MSLNSMASNNHDQPKAEGAGPGLPPLLEAFVGRPRAAEAVAQFLAEASTPPLIEGRAEAQLMAGTYRAASGRSGVQARLESKPGAGKGVAVITISGPLSYRGGVDYESIADEIGKAAADDEAGAILLRFDSPGGDAAMVDVAGAAIRAADKRKPVVAFADPHAFSAAYWLASQARRVVMGPGAMVGSVGVISRHFDLVGLADQFGVKVTEFIYGDKKNLFSVFRTVDEQASADANRILKVIGDEFVAAVAAGRGLDAKVVRGTGAAIFSAREAIENGFADSSATFAELLAEMQADLKVSRAAGARAETAAADEPEPEVTEQTEDTMAETKGTAAEAQASGAQALPVTAAAAKVDVGALVVAMAGYGLDSNKLTAQIAEASASTDDAMEIAQAYVLAGKPAAGLELLKPGAGLTAKQFRSAMVNTQAEASAETEVRTSVQAHEGLNTAPKTAPLGDRIRAKFPDHKPEAWVTGRLEQMRARARG